MRKVQEKQKRESRIEALGMDSHRACRECET